jgi:hypothetical protein
MFYSWYAMIPPEVPESPLFFGISADLQIESQCLVTLNISSDSLELHRFPGA